MNNHLPCFSTWRLYRQVFRISLLLDVDDSWRLCVWIALAAARGATESIKQLKRDVELCLCLTIDLTTSRTSPVASTHFSKLP